jgi:hypothetical protein
MRVLKAIQFETTDPKRDTSALRNADSFLKEAIGPYKLSYMTAARLRKMLNGWKTYNAARERMMAEVPATSDPLTENSLTHRLAAHFPGLPVRNIYKSYLNQSWCYTAMRDIFDRFNAWAESSGFQHELLRRYKSGEHSIIMIGEIEVKYSYRANLSGIRAKLTDKDGNSIALTLHQVGDEVIIGWDNFDSTLGGAVELMETFMKTWTPALAIAA